MDSQDEKFAKLEEKLAKFSAAPSAEGKGKKKFERVDNLTPRQRQMLSRVETIKNRK
jgi:FixJ family two-component response regulator